jgi:hypothetical protein
MDSQAGRHRFDPRLPMQENQLSSPENNKLYAGSASAAAASNIE